jgi:hypothetical protein
MPLTGAAKAQYMRDYHRRRSTAKASVVPSCDFCGEDGGADRILISDYHHAVMICEQCIALAAATIARARV